MSLRNKISNWGTETVSFEIPCTRTFVLCVKILMYNVRMIQRKNTFFLGIFIFLIPFLGLPTFWKTFFIIISGLSLVASSIKIVLPRKLSRTKTRKGKSTPVFVENAPVYPPDNTIEKSQVGEHENLS